MDRQARLREDLSAVPGPAPAARDGRQGRRGHLPRRAPGPHPRPLPPGEHERPADPRVPRPHRRAREDREAQLRSGRAAARGRADRLPHLPPEGAHGAWHGDGLRLRSLGRLPRLHERRHSPAHPAQRDLLQQPPLLPHVRLPGGHSARGPQRAAQAWPRARAEDAEARGRGRTQEHLPHEGRRLRVVRDHREHERRPDRAEPRVPHRRVDRGQPPLLPLQDGRADAALLLVPQRQLGGEAGQVERRRHRDLLRRQAPATTSTG